MRSSRVYIVGVVAGLLAVGGLAVTLPALAGEAASTPSTPSAATTGSGSGPALRITGRIEGARFWSGRPIFVQISRDFPGAGNVTASERVAVGTGGRFALRTKEPGNYWLVAYVDDGDGRLVLGKDIVGFARENPIPLGDGRNAFQGTIRLDPLFVEIWTRFWPASTGRVAQRRLERLRIVPMHPKTGAFLSDAQVFLEGQRLEPSTLGPWFGEGSVSGPRAGGMGGQLAAGRYVVEVRHPSYGASGERRIVAPRAFGVTPSVERTGRGLEWATPSWANFEQAIVIGPEGRLLFEGAVHSPLAVDKWPQGSKIFVRLGRADVQHPGDITVAFGETAASDIPLPLGAP